jgi:hypothetical protein
MISDPEQYLTCNMASITAGEGDNIHIKRCFVRGDEEEISDLVEGMYSNSKERILGRHRNIINSHTLSPCLSLITEWRALIAIFLLESKRSVGLSDIGSR